MTVPYLPLYAASRWKCLFSPQMYGLFLGIRFSCIYGEPKNKTNRTHNASVDKDGQFWHYLE